MHLRARSAVLAATAFLAACSAPPARESASGAESTESTAGAATSHSGNAHQRAAGPTQRSVAVYLDSHEAEHDPCTLSQLRAPDGGDRRIAVRAGPGEQYSVIDSVPSGRQVAGCDHAEGWVGIIYPERPGEDGFFADCEGLSTPVDRRQRYEGPCRSGWVVASEHEVLAG